VYRVNRLSANRDRYPGLGIAPVVAYAAGEAAKAGGETLFEKAFGPSKEFQERQTVREEYQGIADMIRQVAPDFPYHAQISEAIARGATASDLGILKAQWAEYQTSLPPAARSLLPSLPTDFSMAAMPWYVWVIGAGLLVSMLRMR